MREDYDDDDGGKVKHVCKFCDKSFPSGRQLGGHMRSHQNHNPNSLSEPDEIDGKNIRRKKKKKMRVRIKNTNKGLDSMQNFDCTAEFGPGGSRGAYALRENPRKSWRTGNVPSEDQDKPCRECERGIGSWNALFGHVKRHALEDRDSRTSDDQRRRSERRKGYMVVAASSSSLSLVNNNDDGDESGDRNNVGSSVSEIDQEQEDVAMCLMMLSRDVGRWKAADSVVAESSGGITRKRSSSSDLNDSEKGMKTQEELAIDEIGFGFVSGVWLNSEKRARFECTTCNKVFHSYQALGGHMASHTKIRDCFSVAKTNCNDNSIVKTESSHPTNNVRRKNGIVGKKHECPVCLKVFPSGQALGGHKRSHMQQGRPSEHASNVFQPVGVTNPGVNTRDAFDLNLPAQIEDEGSSHVTFSSWCMGSISHSHEGPLARF